MLTEERLKKLWEDAIYAGNEGGVSELLSEIDHLRKSLENTKDWEEVAMETGKDLADEIVISGRLRTALEFAQFALENHAALTRPVASSIEAIKRIKEVLGK